MWPLPPAWHLSAAAIHVQVGRAAQPEPVAQWQRGGAALQGTGPPPTGSLQDCHGSGAVLSCPLLFPGTPAELVSQATTYPNKCGQIGSESACLQGTCHLQGPETGPGLRLRGRKGRSPKSQHHSYSVACEPSLSAHLAGCRTHPFCRPTDPLAMGCRLSPTRLRVTGHLKQEGRCGQCLALPSGGWTENGQEWKCPARSVGKEDQVSASSGSTRSPAKSSLSQEVPLTSTCRVHIPIYSTARQFSSAGQQPATLPKYVALGAH